MQFLRTHKVSDSLYIIEEHLNACVAMALVIGEEKAAIIDTGYALNRDLKKLIGQLTDKPVICLLTHCDPDHAGGAPLFDEVYMNPKDAFMMPNAMNAMAKFQIAKNVIQDKATLKSIKKHMVNEKSFDYQPIKDGDTFDLGGIVLEAIELPGHSPGSTVFLNRNDKYAIAGDSIANINSPVLMFSRCLPLKDYVTNLKRFRKLSGQGIDIYQGHSTKPFSDTLMDEIIELSNDVLAGNTKGDMPYTSPFLTTKPSDSLFKKVLTKIILKKQLGNGISLEHKKSGYTASIKYNANKIK